MNWEELTAPEFSKAVASSQGVCLVSVGCLEKHFEHLPLGTDYLNGHKICCLAAEKEPAVVFPPFYFGQIHEARCHPGAIALSPVLTVQVLTELCDEIARNGFRKIILYNAHGGNWPLLNYLCQAALSQRRPYALYLPEWIFPARRKQEWDSLLETSYHGHACECETSITLANFPHLVKMRALRGRKADPLDRLKLPPGRVTARFYANHPDHYAGDARPATAAKGIKLRQIHVDTLVDYVRAVKKDAAALELLDEFYTCCEKLAAGSRRGKVRPAKRKK